MASNQIPPQAYTREDVAKAYVWVQSQPDFVKNMATTKETLVALYLQARRNGVSSLGDGRLENIAPVSSKDFKNQLQSLATELNQFEKQKEILKAQVPLKPVHTPAPQNVIPEIPDYTQNFDMSRAFEYEQKAPEAKPQSNNDQRNYDERNYDERSIEFKVSERRHTNDEFTFDQKSKSIIEKVKTELNLESDTEVVRMLLTLGFDKLKAIFPQK